MSLRAILVVSGTRCRLRNLHDKKQWRNLADFSECKYIFKQQGDTTTTTIRISLSDN